MGYPVKDKIKIAITNNFQKISKESNRKLSKTWVDKGCRFDNSSMK